MLIRFFNSNRKTSIHVNKETKALQTLLDEVLEKEHEEDIEKLKNGFASKVDRMLMLWEQLLELKTTIDLHKKQEKQWQAEERIWKMKHGLCKEIDLNKDEKKKEDESYKNAVLEFKQLLLQEFAGVTLETHEEEYHHFMNYGADTLVKSVQDFFNAWKTYKPKSSCMAGVQDEFKEYLHNIPSTTPSRPRVEEPSFL